MLKNKHYFLFHYKGFPQMESALGFKEKKKKKKRKVNVIFMNLVRSTHGRILSCRCKSGMKRANDPC